VLRGPRPVRATVVLAVALALSLGALAVGASGGAGGTPGSAQASGFGLLMDGATHGSASAGEGHVTRDAAAQGVTGAAGAVGYAGVSLGAGPRGATGLAQGTATARDALLVGGRIALADLTVSVQAEAGPDHLDAGLSNYSASLTVDGQAIDASPGRQVDVSGVGTIYLFEHVTDAAGSVQANGLRLVVSDPASGLPVGTEIVIGHV
jgi:hypothetical protein